ncbi:hypothetical protein T4E_10869 [Trichinella pseudospiralis]|uniref:Uncharacterized protein n=1 Tax=Trichinella pseudospiralis TaxID=6337 RepID=A0A0V0XIC4_TRIPS|nr:hypothetical protein T4E_10869 [Trichinella pseudospiralis]
MELYATGQAKNLVQLMCSGLDHTPVLLLVDNCNGSMEEENGARQDTQRLHSQHGENEKRVEATGQNKNHLQLLRNNGSTADNTCALVLGGNGTGVRKWEKTFLEDKIMPQCKCLLLLEKSATGLAKVMRRNWEKRALNITKRLHFVKKKVARGNTKIRNGSLREIKGAEVLLRKQQKCGKTGNMERAGNAFGKTAWKQLHNERNVLAEITLLTVFYKFREKGKLCPVLNGSLLHFPYISKGVSSDLMPFLLTSSGQFCDRSELFLPFLHAAAVFLEITPYLILTVILLSFCQNWRFGISGGFLSISVDEFYKARCSCRAAKATLSHPSSLPIRMPRYGTVRCFLCKETVLSFSQCCCRYLSKTTFGLSRIIHFSPCILASHLSSQQPHSRYNCAILWLRAEPLSPDRRMPISWASISPTISYERFFYQSNVPQESCRNFVRPGAISHQQLCVISSSFCGNAIPSPATVQCFSPVHSLLLQEAFSSFSLCRSVLFPNLLLFLYCFLHCFPSTRFVKSRVFCHMYSACVTAISSRLVRFRNQQPLCRVPSNKRPTILSRSARYYQRLFTLSFGAKAVYCPPTLPTILHPQSWVSTCQHYTYFNAPFSLRLVLIWYQYTWFAVQGSPRFLIYAASVFLVNSTVFSSANHKQFCGAERGITHALSRFPSVPAPSTLNKFFTIFLLMRDFSKQHFTLSYTPGFPITPLTPFYPPQSPAAVLHQQLDRRFRRCAAALNGKLRIIFVRIISPLKKLRTSFCRIHNSASTSIYLICCSALSATVDMQSSPKTTYGLCSIQDYLSKKNNAVVTSFPLCPRICYPPKHLCYCRPALCCVLFCQNILRFFTITVQDVRAAGVVLSEKLCIVRDQRSALHYPTSTTILGYPRLFLQQSGTLSLSHAAVICR